MSESDLNIRITGKIQTPFLMLFQVDDFPSHERWILDAHPRTHATFGS